MRAHAAILTNLLLPDACCIYCSADRTVYCSCRAGVQVQQQAISGSVQPPSAGSSCSLLDSHQQGVAVAHAVARLPLETGLGRASTETPFPPLARAGSASIAGLSGSQLQAPAIMPRQSSAGGSSARPTSGGSSSLADELCAEVYGGTLSRIAQLLAACTDPRQLQASNADGYTAMTQAARVNRSRAAELLLQHNCDPEAADSQGRLALATAAAFGSADALSVLLNYGMRLEARDGGGYTACMRAAANGHVGCLRLLLQAGAAAEAATEAEGLSCMHLAAVWGQAECLSLLLATGGASSIPARDSLLRTPMHAAAALRKEGQADSSGRLECIRLLHRAGIALGWRDAHGRTPLDAARACGNVQAAALLEQLAAGNKGSLWCSCERLVCSRQCLSQSCRPCCAHAHVLCCATLPHRKQ